MAIHCGVMEANITQHHFKYKNTHVLWGRQERVQDEFYWKRNEPSVVQR